MLNYQTAPNNLGGSFQRYIEHGIEPGSFLTAVLANDLKEACACADDINRHLLFDLIRWMYNELPVGSWGSSSAVNSWCRRVREMKQWKVEKEGRRVREMKQEDNQDEKSASEPRQDDSVETV